MTEVTEKPTTPPGPSVIVGYEKAWAAGVPAGVGVGVVLWAIAVHFGLIPPEYKPPVELLIGAFVAIGSGIVSAFGAFNATTTPK